LTPSARSANLIAGDGTKNGLSRSEQKTVSTTPNNRLTGKAPYKFESISLQRRVQCEPGFVARTDLPLRRLIRFPSRSLMRPARLCRGYGEPDMDGAPNHG
jgi:hypothetical protein